MQHVAASNNNVPDKLNIILLMNTIIIGLVLRPKVGSTNQIWPSTIETSKELNLHPTSSNDIYPANMLCSLLHVFTGTIKSNGENGAQFQFSDTFYRKQID